MKARRFGEDGWLVETDEPLALAAAVAHMGLHDVVPSEHVVLLRGPRELVQRALRDAEHRPAAAPTGPRLELPVTWDGPDLTDVADTTAMSVEAVIATLTSTELTVAFCGFAPGFGYLTGLPAQLHVPRRARPRPRIPAGSVAIAAGYAAVYPTDSPGGWHVLGTCTVTLFDPDAEPPARLTPGTTVRFV